MHAQCQWTGGGGGGTYAGAARCASRYGPRWRLPPDWQGRTAGCGPAQRCLAAGGAAPRGATWRGPAAPVKQLEGDALLGAMRGGPSATERESSDSCRRALGCTTRRGHVHAHHMTATLPGAEGRVEVWLGHPPPHPGGQPVLCSMLEARGLCKLTEEGAAKKHTRLARGRSCPATAPRRAPAAHGPLCRAAATPFRQASEATPPLTRPP